MELGVSRAPVREAIRMLEQEHLIVRHPHRGLFVASPTAGEILQVASYRALLEIYAVRWGRPHSRDEIDALDRACDAMDVAAVRGDVLAAVTEDLRFHGIVASVCDNAALLGHFHELDGHMALFLHALTDNDRGGRAAAMGDRHREVARALAGGPDAADPAIREHYRSASLALIERSSDDTAGVDWSSKWRLA